MKITTTHTGAHAKFFRVGKNVTTRVIHHIVGASSRCGSSRRNQIVTLREAQAADHSRFCEKCFQAGKPAEFYEIDA